MEDSKIIDLYWQRSEQAITESQRKYGGYCRSIALRILGDSRDSEECVNDTWLGAWQAMPPQRPAVLSTFLGRITRNLALNRHRENRAQKRGAGEIALALEELGDCLPAPDGGTVLDELILSEALSRFIVSLQPQAQRFFVQRYWYLCPVREIARLCQVGESRVKMSLHRSRQALKAFLQKEGISI